MLANILKRCNEILFRSPPKRCCFYVRVINEKVDDDLKIKKGENWGKIFCGDKGKRGVKWKNYGVLMCSRWFSRQYCFDDCNHKESHVSDGKVPEGKRKEYKSYLKKSENDNAGRDLGESGLSGSLLPGVNLQQLLARAATSKVPHWLTDMNPGTRSRIFFKRLDRALIQGLWPENALTRLY